MRSVYSWNVLKLSCRTACCSLLMVQRIQQVIFAVHALVIAAADGKLGLEFGQRTEGILVFQLRFGARDTDRPMPSMREVVPAKYASTSSLFRPIASKTCAP